ncbi:MAG: hypothetical protein WBC36_08715, partial [Desulfobacterales bacterium]
MKPRYLRKGGGYLLLCTVMILGAFLLIGCGSDGDTGATGPTGPAGPPGEVAPGGPDIPATAETCSICHGAGKIADIAVAHPDDPAFTGSEVTISNITLTNTGGVPEVTFDLTYSASGLPVTTIDGNPVDVDMFRFMMADLVPAGTDTLGGWGTWDSPYFERWTYERTPGTTGWPQGTLVDNGGGNYTYTFATAFGSAEALADAPDLDHTPGTGHVQRLFVRFDGRDDAETITQRAVGFLDFTVPADGAAAVALDPQRQFVTAETCKECHGANFERAAHANGYRDTRTCALCHSPLGFDTVENEDRGQIMQDADAYSSVLFHKIHAAIDIPAFSNRIDGRGYGAVTYPQEIRDCVVCHNDGGQDLGGQAALIDNWKTNPTIEICSSCHFPGSGIGNDVDLVTGVNHEGGQQPNSACTICHLSGGQSTTVIAPIPVSHDLTPRTAGTNGTRDDGYLPSNIREFDVTLSITPPINGTFYDVGEEPEVTATLVNRTDGQPVAPALYTTPKDSTGNVGDGLSVAYVQVSGPRARPLPVLATDSFTYPNWGGDPEDIEDEHDLFVLGTDPQVKTDSFGFRYQLLPIPADLDPGTYLVRVVFADYGRVGSGNYQIDSTAWTTIQIGTATVEPKVSGDACVNCHSSGTAPFHDERHSVPFDTDQCLAC